MATFVVAPAIPGDEDRCEKVLGAGGAEGLAGVVGQSKEAAYDVRARTSGQWGWEQELACGQSAVRWSQGG